MGAEIEIVSDRSGVFIVKLKDGTDPMGFAILRKELSNEPVDQAPADPPADHLEHKKAPAVRRPGRFKPAASPGPGASSGQGSLF